MLGNVYKSPVLRMMYNKALFFFFAFSPLPKKKKERKSPSKAMFNKDPAKYHALYSDMCVITNSSSLCVFCRDGKRHTLNAVLPFTTRRLIFSTS